MDQELREATELSMKTTIDKCIEMIVDALHDMKNKSAKDLGEAMDQAEMTAKFYHHASTILRLTNILNQAGMF